MFSAHENPLLKCLFSKQDSMMQCYMLSKHVFCLQKSQNCKNESVCAHNPKSLNELLAQHGTYELNSFGHSVAPWPVNRKSGFPFLKLVVRFFTKIARNVHNTLKQSRALKGPPGSIFLVI